MLIEYRKSWHEEKLAQLEADADKKKCKAEAMSGAAHP